MYTPSATYRLQLHKDFTFRQLKEIIPYLHELGISTIYASPITRAGTSSSHGYDVTDPGSINPEIGSLEELQEIASLLKEKQMGWLQDIVPNHMSFSQHNHRLMDVLERGSLSQYHGYFDILWDHPQFTGKLMVPFLGEALADCIEQGHIQLRLTHSGILVQYHEQAYPLSIPAYRHLLASFHLQAKGTELPGELELLLVKEMENAPYENWLQHKISLFQQLTGDHKKREQVEQWLATFNADKKQLQQLLNLQYYQLCHWQQVNEVINYRRFFTISSLLCVRMEAEGVFADYHQFLHQLYQQELIQGLRIDHIDGLYDPALYIKQLRHLFGNDCYIVAEKILEGDEAIPADWLLQGTTGYEFLSSVSQLLTNRQGAIQLLKIYRALLPQVPSYDRQVVHNKLMILERYMQGEWNNLVRYFDELELPAHKEGHWKKALAAFMAALPVYRLYPSALPLPAYEQTMMEEAFAQARQMAPDCISELDYLHALFNNQATSKDKQKAALLFLKRLMQFSGPLMAKGVEDTTFYNYNPLIAHNEVGDTPLVPGATIGGFHAAMKIRQAATPLSLNATATHDTKRGEDARMRLNVLANMPAVWEEAVKNWQQINKHLHSSVDGVVAPLPNDEYFIYQSIIGGFPEDGLVTDEWIQRLQEYVRKVIRESKVKSSWEDPHLAYEQAGMDFITKLFQQDHVFLPQLISLMEQINEQAAVYSLGQLLIKITAPGIPDMYQGTELWDYSFVDPDNRRPVDYDRRTQYLQQIKEQESKGSGVLFAFLRHHRLQGMEKLFLCYKALHYRNACNELFTSGDYLPLSIIGEKDIAVAYARQLKHQWSITAIPVDINIDTNEAYNRIQLPPDAPDTWENILTGEKIQAVNQQLLLKDTWHLFPVAILKSL